MVAAQETVLKKILEGSEQYVIPLYQRPYSWTKKEWAVLWEDIVQLAEERHSDPTATHFIGSLVLSPSPRNVVGNVSLQLVVDGQQRLTTISLLLAAMRDHRIDVENDAPESRREIDRINNQFLTNQYEDDPYRLKLLPTQQDRAAFGAVIDRGPLDNEGTNIQDAYRFFRGKLAAYDDPDDPEDINILQKAVTDGLALVAISTQPGDNVHRIFESLNNTGLKLTQADLLRNYLFMRLPTHGDDVYRRVWDPLQSRLNPKDLETLFWIDARWRVAQTKRDDTYTQQTTRLDKLETEEEIVAEVEHFAYLGELFAIAQNPEKEHNPEVRRRLEHLVQWDSTTLPPLTVKLLQVRDQGYATDSETAEALLYVESLFVRCFLCNRPTHGLNRFFASLCQQIDQWLEQSECSSIGEFLRRALSRYRRYFPTDEELAEAVLHQPYYKLGNKTRRPILLAWLEDTYGSKEPVDVSTCSIEHIMPQKLSKGWQEALVHEVGVDAVAEKHEEYVHTLGNLTLTGYNAEMGNRSFAEKKERLRESGIRMSADIIEHGTWGFSDIEARGQAIAQRLAQYWPGPRTEEETTPNGLAESWAQLRGLLAIMPDNSWAQVGDVARVVGVTPGQLRAYIDSHSLRKADRVVTGDDAGRDPAGRLNYAELMEMVAEENGEEVESEDL